MKANELKVGNMIELYGKEVTVIGIDRTLHGDYHVTYNDGVTDYRVARYLDQFNPIPLTDEWLVKFGFEVVSNEPTWVEWTNGSFGISYNGKVFESSLFVKPHKLHMGEWHELVEVKSVHQLQNLYFALTGEELTLK